CAIFQFGPELTNRLREPIGDPCLAINLEFGLSRSQVAPGDHACGDGSQASEQADHACPDLDLVVGFVLQQISFKCEPILDLCRRDCGFDGGGSCPKVSGSNCRIIRDVHLQIGNRGQEPEPGEREHNCSG